MRHSNSARNVAFAAVPGVLSLLILLAASAAPTGKLGLAALAGILPAGAVISVSVKAGFLCWAAVSLLGLLFVPDKFVVLLFAVLFGLYPMLKYLVEERRWKRPWELLLKLAFFNAALALLAGTMGTALLGSLGSLPDLVGSRGIWLLVLAGNAVFLAYDFGFSKLIAFYIARIARVIRD